MISASLNHQRLFSLNHRQSAATKWLARGIGAAWSSCSGSRYLRIRSARCTLPVTMHTAITWRRRSWSRTAIGSWRWAEWPHRTPSRRRLTRCSRALRPNVCRALEDALTMPPRYGRDYGQERTDDIGHRDREATSACNCKWIDFGAALR